jgi:hypothetical protein
LARWQRETDSQLGVGAEGYWFVSPIYAARSQLMMLHAYAMRETQDAMYGAPEVTDRALPERRKDKNLDLASFSASVRFREKMIDALGRPSSSYVAGAWVLTPRITIGRVRAQMIPLKRNRTM